MKQRGPKIKAMVDTQTGKQAVLFVDDEENILSALKRELRTWAKEKNLNIETVTSAAAALEILGERSGDFAVVVSDLRMPGMMGSDFLVSVRNRWPSIVTMLLSGFSEIDEVLKAVKAGIFSYLIKPWDSEFLISELNKALETRLIEKENEELQNMLQEELRWAGEMQRSFLQPAPLKQEGIDFRSTWRPMPGIYCGGDYYDMIGVGQGRFLIIIGEAAGRGLRGALVTAILKAVIYPEYVRAFFGKPLSPAHFLSWLNKRTIFELKNAAPVAISFFAAVLDRNELSLTYANAGHPLPVILRNGAANELANSGSPLGEDEKAVYRDTAIPLRKDDVFVAFTDGFKNLGGSRGAAIAREAVTATPYGDEYHKRLLESLLAHSGSSVFADDVTLLSIRIV